MSRFSDVPRLFALSSLAVLAYTQQAAAQDPNRLNCYPNYIYAQRLIDETIARHPELAAVVMHVTPPGSSENIVIASNLWLTGEKSDDDDVGVIKSGTTMTEMNPAGNKYEVQGVLKNVLGATVGSVATVFPYRKGESTDLLQKRAAEIRAELSKHVLNSANLMEPFPFDPQIPWNTVAKTVMEQEMRKYSDVLVFAMQVKTPNRQSNVIVASNIGRIGKIGDDPKDISVITSGKPNAALKSSDERAQVVLPLKDSTGKVIGVLNLLLHNGEDKDEAGMIARGEMIRDDTATLIPGVTALFEPVHP